MSVVALVLVVAAAAVFFQRRAHRVLFVPEAPSRGMSVDAWSAAPAVERLRVLFVGHSLIGQDMPAMAQGIAESLGVSWAHDVQLVDGGSLHVNWTESERAIGVDAAAALETGEYDAIVLTEAVSLDDHLRWSEPSRYAARYYGLAGRHRPDVRLFFYETWHPRDEPRVLFGVTSQSTWRELLDEDLAKWEHIVDGARESLDGAVVHIVPGGQAMAALSDAVEGGQVPGVSELTMLFTDGVHLSRLGQYFIALVQVATLTRTSPVGATHEVRVASGQAVSIAPELAAALQQIAWRAVRGYPRSGVLAPPAGDARTGG